MLSKLELTVTLFVGLLACSNSLSSPNDDIRSGKTEKRHDSSDASCDDFPEYLVDSSDCVNIEQIPVVIHQLENDLAYNTKANRDLLETTLDGFCNTECYDHVVFYYTNCNLSPSLARQQLYVYQNLVCGRDGGTYCAIAGLEKLANGDINPLEIALQCYTDGYVCPREECIDILEGISRSLDCCAGTLFNSSVSIYSLYLSTLEVYYKKCNLTLPAPCSGYAFVPAVTVVIALVLLVLLLLAFLE